MSVPKDIIKGRLQANINTLLQTGSKMVRGLFLSEITSPFRSAGQSGEASPFLKSLFPEIRLAAMLERSLNTALGWGWDKIAGDIARATHGNAEVGYFVAGQIPANTANQIDALCADYTSGDDHGSPNTVAELAFILPGVGAPGAKEDVREKDDLFYVATDGIENHIEIKTPKPNYDQMRAAKRRILRLHAVRAPTPVRAFVGMPYNPNGLFGEYGWPTTKYFADFNRDILIGRDFWNHIGQAQDTYEDLLDCFLEVSEQRRPDLVALLEGKL
jgi:Type II restriction endonuclease, TdeIII